VSFCFVQLQGKSDGMTAEITGKLSWKHVAALQGREGERAVVKIGEAKNRKVFTPHLSTLTSSQGCN
jgi:hypothetical protein